jgi:two-component system response regulator BaeR
MSAKVLIVEDEADLSSIMADYAIAAGYEAEVIDNGQEALVRLQQRTPDVVVLDIMLPGLDGLALCQALRGFSDVPIIMVTARTEEIDRLLGLDAGADDYLCKPFSPRELVARIKAILRRRRLPDASATILQVDESTRAIRIQGQALDLTSTEYNLLAAMAKRPGTIFSRAQLLDLARRDNLDVNDRAIDTHIKNLRRKVAAHLPDVDIIQSVYGVGYRVEF